VAIASEKTTELLKIDMGQDHSTAVRNDDNSAKIKPCAIGPSVTVIIPTYNSGERFKDVLEGLKKQAIKPHEIIVVDSQSSDSTVELAKKHNCNLIPINKDDFGHGKTRNMAASKSETEFLLFLTHDAVAANGNLIKELIEPMVSNPNIAICYGRHLPNADARPLESLFRKFNYPAVSSLKTLEQINETGLKTFFCSNSCSAVRRSTFEKLGEFDSKAITNEDMLFGAKAILKGYSIYYAAEAKVYHSHNYSMGKVFRRYFKIGRFFARNRSVLPKTKVRGYGLKMLNFGICKSWQRSHLLGVTALLFELAIKAIAYNLGYCYQLPLQKKKYEF